MLSALIRLPRRSPIRGFAHREGGVRRTLRRPTRWRRPVSEGGGDGGVEGVGPDVLGRSVATRVTEGRAGGSGRRARPPSSPSPSRPWARRARRRRCRGACRRAARSGRLGSCGACGRNEKIPPPSLSTTTIRRSASRPRSAVSAPASWTKAMSPTRHDGGPPAQGRRGRGHHPSMPLAPRLAWPGRRAAEPLEVAHRHRGRHDELGRGQEVAGDRAGDRRLGQHRPRVAGRVDRRLGRAGGRQPAHACPSPPPFEHRPAPAAPSAPSVRSTRGRGRSRRPPTWTTGAPDAATHSASTLDAAGRPTRTTTSGVWSAAKRSWRSSASAHVAPSRPSRPRSGQRARASPWPRPAASTSTGTPLRPPARITPPSAVRPGSATSTVRRGWRPLRAVGPRRQGARPPTSGSRNGRLR